MSKRKKNSKISRRFQRVKMCVPGVVIIISAASFFKYWVDKA